MVESRLLVVIRLLMLSRLLVDLMMLACGISGKGGHIELVSE